MKIQVTAIENGTVIDHIPTDKVFQVAALLQLLTTSCTITIANNLCSEKMGKKGMIKIADVCFTDEEINRIAIVAPNVVLNTIRNTQVVEKRHVELPDVLQNIVSCANPQCITNSEPMPSLFKVIDKQQNTLRCHYCEKEQKLSQLEIKNT